MKASILNFVLGASAVAATAIDFAMGGLNCASEPSPAFLESVKEMYHNESIKSTEFGAMAAADDKVNIITYIHVVASGYSVSDGYISVSTLRLGLARRMLIVYYSGKTHLTKSMPSMKGSRTPNGSFSTKAQTGPSMRSGQQVKTIGL